MNDNTAKLLQELSDKLGTTTELLWSILLKQAPIDATISLIQIILMVSSGYVLIFINDKRVIYNKEHSGFYSDDTMYWTGLIAGGIIYCLLLAFCLGLLEDVINGFFNPQYWALDKILDTLKSHR